jgi:hypothetical protein
MPAPYTGLVSAAYTGPVPPSAQTPPSFGPAIDEANEIQRLRGILTTLLQALREVHQAKAGAQALTPPPAPALAAPTAQPVALAPAAAPAVGSTVSISASPEDQRRVNAAIGQLASLRSGAGVASQLQANGARFVVDADSTFAADGYGSIQAYYNETDNVIHLRQSVVEDSDPSQLIYEIAHEGTHFVDAASPAKRAWTAQRQAYIQRLGGASTQAGVAAQQQYLLDDSLITETNAHTVGGAVMNELGVARNRLKTGGPAWTGMGGGDAETVRHAVWNSLLQSPTYNPNGMTSQYQTYA